MKDHSQFYIPVLSFLVLSNIVLLAVFVSGIPDNVQSYVCEANRCTLQDWLSATAGWVGFFAAAIAAWFVYAQLAEQRKQTAFMLGDAAPTVSPLAQSVVGDGGSIQVQNWNREDCYIHAVRVTCRNENLAITGYNHIGVTSAGQRIVISVPLKDGRCEFRLNVGGWLRRSDAPNTADIQLNFIEDYGTLIKRVKDEAVTVTVTLYWGANKREYDLDGHLRAFLIDPERVVPVARLAK